MYMWAFGESQQILYTWVYVIFNPESEIWRQPEETDSILITMENW